MRSSRFGRPGRLAAGLAALVLWTALSGCGLVARAQAGVPLDDSATSVSFISWALSAVRAESGSSSISAVTLDRNELDLTMRTGAHEQRWLVLPQDLPRLVGTQQLTVANGVVDASGFAPEDLVTVWSDFHSDDSSCSLSDIRVGGTASWGGQMRYTASCAQGDRELRSWIGSWPVELQGTLSTRTSLDEVLSDLRKLSPSSVAAVDLVMPGMDTADCRASASWRQELAGRQYWIDQTRMCYVTGDESYLPGGTVPEPADAASLLAHPLQLASIDSSVLEGLTGESGLPSQQWGIDRFRIAWSDRFGRQVIEAHSGEGSTAETGWYTLAGELLALDRA